MTRTETRMIETRKRIVEAAFQVFGQVGYRSARISDIAELADVGYGTFYQYFKNKKALLLYILEELSKKIGDYGYLKKNKGLSLRDRLYYGVFDILRYYIENRSALTALIEAEIGDKEVKESRDRLQQKLFDRVSYDIHYFIRKGLCRPEVDDCVVVALYCMINGYAARMMEDSTLSKDISRIAESLTEVSYRVLFEG